MIETVALTTATACAIAAAPMVASKKSRWRCRGFVLSVIASSVLLAWTVALGHWPLPFQYMLFVCTSSMGVRNNWKIDS